MESAPSSPQDLHLNQLYSSPRHSQHAAGMLECCIMLEILSKSGLKQCVAERSGELMILAPCAGLSRLVVSDSLWPQRLQPARLLCPWDFPGKNTRLACHALLQGIFPTQGLSQSHLHLPHCRRILHTSEPPDPLRQISSNVWLKEQVIIPIHHKMSCL